MGGFVRESSSDSYVLLGGGGHKLESSLSVGYAAASASATYATTAGSANSVAWDNITGKPSIPYPVWGCLEVQRGYYKQFTGFHDIFGLLWAPNDNFVRFFHMDYWGGYHEIYRNPEHSYANNAIGIEWVGYWTHKIWFYPADYTNGPVYFYYLTPGGPTVRQEGTV